MNHKYLSTAILLAVLVQAPLFSKEVSDTVSTEKFKSDRSVMLNAESGSAPRSISFGLPSNGSPAIREDGMALAYGNSPATPYFHWAGGNSYSHQTLLSVPEATILAGDIGFVVDSFSRLGGEEHENFLTFGSSTNGLIRFDGAVSGPLGKDWYYSAGAYLNYDPTSVNTPSRKFIEKKQICRAAISRRWTNASIDLLYKFAICNDGTDGYAYAPFIYNGDGSISEVNGFRIGRDCYMPADDAVSYTDVITGAQISGNLGKMDQRQMHDVMLKGHVDFDNDWKLDAQIHFTGSPCMNSVKMSLVGIDYIQNGLTAAGAPVTYSNGAAYNGYMQNRLASVSNAKYSDWMNQIVMSKRSNKHYLRIGLNGWYDEQHDYVSTFNFAHTVSANPERLMLNGKADWNDNRNATYSDGGKAEITGFIIDEYNSGDRFSGRIGLRAKWNYFNVNCACNEAGETCNTRTEGFYINNGIVRTHDYEFNLFDYAATTSANYRIAGRLFASGEGLFAASNKGPGAFKSAKLPPYFPTFKPSLHITARGGLMWDNEFMDITSMLSYVSSLNSTSIMSVTKQLNGVSETQTYTAEYAIGTWGLTTEANFYTGGFRMHTLLTLQNPKYRNYDNNFTFSDGSSEQISYTGNFVSGISRVQLELDPSYKTGPWRFWASARYFSRQYVSRTNNAYFNGHWETFAGIDRKISDKCSVKLSFVNVLMQNGAKGSIDVADTITDASLLNGLVMAGSYIRPFTVDFGISFSL